VQVSYDAYLFHPFHSKGGSWLVTKEAVRWRSGDRIVIAATDYDENESELVTITSVSADMKNVSFSPPARFIHFGQILTTVDGETIDMRAEVALLDRNVIVHGSLDGNTMATGWGGHIIRRDRSILRITGVEVYHAGQLGVEGRYPIVRLH
jgi:cell surface hyaluronidase